VRPEARHGKPLLVFDGECGFCTFWIARWHRLTGEGVDYAPYQEVAGRFPGIPLEQFQSAVQLIEPDGSISQGAEAVVRSLLGVRGLGWLPWIYRHVPGVAPLGEGAYRFVANHRPFFSRLTRWICGTDPEPPEGLS
jgi:predicted DCC family thiol-disulfide oxidoreductase YuxK